MSARRHLPLFAVRSPRRQGSRVSFAEAPSFRHLPSAQAYHFFLLLFSFIIFLALLWFLLCDLCTHEPRGDPRKSGDPEMYAVCDVFEALCRDTIGGSPLFVRVYRIHRAFSSRPLRNRLITVIYISRRF